MKIIPKFFEGPAIYTYQGEYWVLYFASNINLKARHYDQPFREIELNYLQFTQARRMETVDDMVELILYKYRNQ